MEYIETTVSTEPVYDGSIIRVEKLTVTLPNGKTATRDVVRHQGASAVVPVTAEGDVLLTRQFRKPNEFVSVELPAGKLDSGEAPETCAARELQEETGYGAGSLVHLFSMKSTPGFSDEIIHMYLANGTCLPAWSNPDEDEFITTFSVPFEEATAMIRDGRITDGKTIAGIFAAMDHLSREKSAT